MPQWPASDPVDLPLSDAELDRLSDLLERYAVPHGGMSLEMLDGFLSALAVGPEPVPPSEYEADVWGHEAPALPPGDDGRDAQLLVMRLAGSVARRVRIPPEDLQSVHMPVLAHPDHEPDDGDTVFELGKEWAIGFIEGVAFRESAWDAWRSDLGWIDEDLAELAVLAGYEIDPPEPLTWAERNAMVAEIPDMLYALHEQRLAQQRPAPARAEPRPGRNEPCPCGSGQKFKKCCGATPTVH